ncbi:MAG: 5'-methylthioadenosine/adenosylhomocysteine nucleosidase, partial [Planifilum fulgidum]
CVEMEGAAVAHVCHLNRVPFVIIRSISDRADHSANVNFTRFTKMASRRSAGIVRRMLAELRQKGLSPKS